MTCIAGVADGKRVWMGADSYAGNGYSYVLTQRPKVRKVGEFLIGGAGSLRGLDAAHFLLEVTTTGARDVERYMRTTFVDALRKALQKAGVKERLEGVESVDTTFLVGFRGRLFCVGGDFSVLSVPAWGYAVGIGEAPAAAVLYALRGSRMKPETRIRAALKAAEATTEGVRSPFHLEAI